MSVLLVNNDKEIIKKLFVIWGKLQRTRTTIKWSYFPTYLGENKKVPFTTLDKSNPRFEGHISCSILFWSKCICMGISNIRHSLTCVHKFKCNFYTDTFESDSSSPYMVPPTHLYMVPIPPYMVPIWFAVMIHFKYSDVWAVWTLKLGTLHYHPFERIL